MLRFPFLVRLALLLLLAAPASAAPPATPAPSAQINIAQVTCGDLQSATPIDRSAIVMFYWGYEAAKANATTFRTGVLENATSALMTECSGNAAEPVLTAMSRINVKAF